MNKHHLVIATRESPLAMRQAELIKAQLMHAHPGLTVEFLGITTQADRRLDILLTDIGGKGLFVKELEEALLDGRADIAVHCVKDMPMNLPDGLFMPVISKREDPRDVFVSNKYPSFESLPKGARVGTSSLRRQTQLSALRSDLEFLPLRGNIQTRLGRLDKDEYEAIILAGAGLRRMDLTNRITSYLSTETSLPAAGQGALGIECLEGNQEVIALIAPLNDADTEDCIIAERALCRKLGAGCQVPVAAFAELHQGKIHVRGLVSNRNGTHIIRAESEGVRALADSIGAQVAEELQALGAEKILSEFQ